jgi:hypothetical protein
MAGGRASRATISARGGTTGRAAGWPTRFGLAGGRSGAPPDIVPPPTVCEGGGAAAPGVGLSAGRAGIGIVGTAALGRGTPGVVIITGGAGAEGAVWAAGGGALICALTPCPLTPGELAAGEVLAVSAIGGIGWRGPERICPGLGGGGAEREGITGPRLAGAFGPPGCPVANGGRNGNAGRTGTGASEFSGGAETVGFAGSGATGGGALFETGAGSSTATADCRAGSCRGAASWLAACSSAPIPATRRRRFSTTSSSSELECVFLSVTPNSGNKSRMTLGLTSSSRASSLIRILLIHKTPERCARCSRDCALNLSQNIARGTKFYFSPSTDSAFSIVTDSFSGSLATLAAGFASSASGGAAAAADSLVSSGATSGVTSEDSNCP